MTTAVQSIDYGSQVRTYKAEGTIVAGQVLKAGSAKMSCLQATAALTEGIIGIALTGGSTGAHIDVAEDGAIAPCTTGAAVTKGKPVTSDANGKCIDAAPGAGVTIHCVGEAVEAAGAADLKIGIRVRIQRVTNGGT